MKAHSESIKSVLEKYDTKREGLDSAEAEKRLKEHGPNEIKHQKKVSALKIFLSQFKSFLVIILLIAVGISLVLGEGHYFEAIVIGAILLLNTIFGFIWEYRAEKTIEALQSMASHKVTVIRDQEKRLINAKELVPGDILIIEEGDKISADARLIESYSLETQEAALTGESLPVEKNIYKLKPNTAIAERKNMAFSGTIATRGRAIGVVTSTGMDSELGRVAHMIEKAEKEIPLKKQLDSLGKWIGIVVIAIAIIIFITLMLRGEPLLSMLVLAIALAVAAVPEGLPAVVTIGLALGVQKMAKKKALIRKLPSVETLGSTTVICTDKTGTLTMNEMTVKKLYVNRKVVSVTGQGYNTEGKFSEDVSDLKLLLKIGALCNDSSISHNNNKLIGDPTEGALIISAMKAGMGQAELEQKWPRIGEIPFSSERKMMTTFHKHGKKKLSLVKGALDNVLEKCDKIYLNGKIRKLTSKEKKDIINQANDFAKHALRVLAFAFREFVNENNAEEELVFVGLQGMRDPARSEARTSIKKCKKAGIKVKMVTGDHKLTAEAIAKEVGLEGETITGEELAEMSDKELVKRINKTAVFARVNPKDKIRIVRCLKNKGHIVAMTGDGVNDAPALKEANIGVSMSITGTDVAKEAADMVLLDDNFATIVNAVEEGRGIYQNIRKFVMFLLSCNIAEVLIVFLAVLMGLPLPFLAIQILWINLVTDSFPALALSVDPKSQGIMKKKPRNPKEHIINREIGINTVLLALLATGATLFIFSRYADSLKMGQTIAFVTLVMIELAVPFIIRSRFGTKTFANKWLFGAIFLSLILQLLVIYTPLSKLFETVALGAEWLPILIVTAIVATVGTGIELISRKYFSRA